MKNKESLDFFRNIAEQDNVTELSCKLFSKNDHTQLDADFILKHCDTTTNLLDLGSGSGLIINKIYNKVAKITAVEPFKSFTDLIVKSDNIFIENKTLEDYTPAFDEHFSLLTIFGTMHYFNENEAIAIYTKYINFLNDGGKIIIKNQFGVTEDVVISGYSQELKTDYYAWYRHIDKEVAILKQIGFKNIEVVDIYPPEANRWNNTHFYAIVAEK